MINETSILSVLMYLFKHHLQKDQKLSGDDNLIEELEDAGFKRLLIVQAFEWLASLAFETALDDGIAPSATSFRVYSTEECQLISADCRSLLLSLEHAGVLTNATRETVINQLLQLEDEGIDINLVKWVTMMVLFNTPEMEQQLSNMELLILSESVHGEH